VEVVDVRTGVTVALVRQHGDSVNAVVFAPGGNTQLISASDDQTVAEWPCAACGNQEAAIRAAVDATPEH
jgi:WD40 repeat protein